MDKSLEESQENINNCRKCQEDTNKQLKGMNKIVHCLKIKLETITNNTQREIWK